jgi:hypothetical protein
MRRIQLGARTGRRSGRGRWLVPPWIAPAFFLFALILIVWRAFLVLTLPRNYTANHWRVAWGGFDIGLGAALIDDGGGRCPAVALCRGCRNGLWNAAGVRRLVRRADVTYHR